MENTKNSSLAKLFPVMLCFFAMGFVELVGIASNYVKADLNPFSYTHLDGYKRQGQPSPSKSGGHQPLAVPLCC